MRHKTLYAAILMTMTAAGLLTGCAQPYAEKKQAMEEQWQKSTALAKLPVVEDLIRQGKLQEAKETLNKCLLAAPEMPGVHLLIGRVYFIEGQIQRARRSFAKAVELDPEQDKGWFALGSLAVQEKDYEQAMECFQKALALKPANTDYIISVCDLYIETQQADQAREALEAAMLAQPGNLDLLLEAARLYERAGETEKALRTYEQAQLIHGDLPQVLEPAGYAYMTAGQWEKAAEKFEGLLAHDQQDPEHSRITLRSLAMCSFNAQNFARALSCYDKLSVTERDDPAVWMGMAQSALGLEDTNRAIYCANRALKLQPGWPKGYAVLGSALYLKGDYEPSLDAFEQITANEEYDAFAWFMTGRCYRQLRRPVEAETAFKQAEQLDPDNEMIRKFLKKTLKFL